MSIVPPPQGTWLAVNCGAEGLALALTRNPATTNTVLAREHRRSDSRNRCADSLVSAISHCLERAGSERADAVAVCVGPGSFTGIRVALAAAHGLSLSWNLGPPFGVDSLSALRRSIKDDPTTTPDMLVAIRSGRNDLYVRWFGSSSSPLHRWSGFPVRVDPARVAETVARHNAAGHPAVRAVGSGAAECGDCRVTASETSPVGPNEVPDTALLPVEAMRAPLPPLPLYLARPRATWSADHHGRGGEFP